MNVIDIVLICALVLFGLIGFAKGFLTTLLSFVGSLLSIVASTFVAKPLAGLLNSWFHIGVGIGNAVSGQIGEFFTEFASATGSEILANHCSASGMLKAAFQFLINPDTTYTRDEVINTIGTSTGNIATIAIALIVSFILIKIIILILAKIFDAAKKKSSAINGLDKFLGFITGLVKCFIIYSVLCIIASLLQNIPAVASALDTVFNGSNVAKPIYDFITNLTQSYLSNIDFATLASHL